MKDIQAAYEELSYAICYQAVVDYWRSKISTDEQSQWEAGKIERFFRGRMFAVIMPDLDGDTVINLLQEQLRTRKIKVPKLQSQIENERRKKRKKAGLCRSCGTATAIKGQTMCCRCRDRARGYAKRKTGTTKNLSH